MPLRITKYSLNNILWRRGLLKFQIICAEAESSNTITQNHGVARSDSLSKYEVPGNNNNNVVSSQYFADTEHLTISDLRRHLFNRRGVK